MTSSPYHPKSNGKAVSAVKVVKSLIKKAQRDNKDPWLSLLDYRNTPTTGMQTSPAQRLMSRRTKTLVPIAPTCYTQKSPKEFKIKYSENARRPKAFTTGTLRCYQTWKSVKRCDFPRYNEESHGKQELA